MKSADTIWIEGLEFYAFHGATNEEQTVGHRYIADVTLTVDTRPAGRSDELGDTVSYADVARRIVEESTTQQYRLLEALIERLAKMILNEFQPVQTVQLRIAKICPPMDAIVARVGVEITRSRVEDSKS